MMNIWNYEEEGNYWNDYTGQDLDADGIGDTPYVMDDYSLDNYPLMGMLSEFSIIAKNEIYSVTIISNSTISDFIFEVGEETGNRIMSFEAAGQTGTVGFCRVKIPTKLMRYPYVILVGDERVAPTLLDNLNETQLRLYFTYSHQNQTITIISSETLRLYYELLDKYVMLEEHLYELNKTYYALLSNYTMLQMDLSYLNETYYSLLSNYNNLSDYFAQLQMSFDALNSSLQSLLTYSDQMQNIQNLIYIFTATTGILIIAAVYLSRSAHSGTTKKTKVIE